MKRKGLIPFCFLLLLGGLFSTCNKMKEVGNFFTSPTAREQYQQQFKEDAPLLLEWKQRFQLALQDSISISLPYVEKGFFPSNSFPIYTYTFQLEEGVRLVAEVVTDSSENQVFMDLLRKDTLGKMTNISAAQWNEKVLSQEIEEDGTYQLIIQPEIAAQGSFQYRIFKESIYAFPVASKGNRDIQSFWGAPREAGRRRHEGVDIFAKRGTPVVAATEGRISYAGRKGLGGKQVWMQDRDRGLSLYYAHLDSILVQPRDRVEAGDTIGLVGNTGNAATTPPHLHFGIYKPYRGATNPLPFIRQHPKPVATHSHPTRSQWLIVMATANLRKGPSLAAPIFSKATPQDTLKFLGKTTSWFHFSAEMGNGFIHESLVRPVE